MRVMNSMLFFMSEMPLDSFTIDSQTTGTPLPGIPRSKDNANECQPNHAKHVPDRNDVFRNTRQTLEKAAQGPTGLA